MKDFNIAKYLKEHNLGSHGILGKYVDLHGLKEEEDYGNNKPVDEVPYTGAEEKLDGFGDEFDQVEPVSELDKPKKIYTNDWINDSIDGKKVGAWTCYYEDFQDVIYWVHDKINSEDIVVYATPDWENVEGVACEVAINSGEYTVDHKILGSNSYPDFESYAKDVKPYLQMVEEKYSDGGYNLYFGKDSELEEPSTEIGEEVSVSSSGVEMEEAMDDEDGSSDHFNKSVIAANMEQIYDQFEPQVQELISDIVDDGFDLEDAIKFLRNYADRLEKVKPF